MSTGDLVKIKKADYVPDLEEKVKYYMSITPDLPKNDKKPIRAKEPSTVDPIELKIWRTEELRRIKQGHFNMSPKMYFWYNYCKIWDIENDSIFRPEFRVAQQEWFKAIEIAQASKEFGLICVKRRRFGASWMIAADVLHDCITSGLFKVGMTSKSEEDAKELFKKVKFLYDNLPEWMKPNTSAGNTQTSMLFAWKEKSETGNWKTFGLQSEIIVKPPTETSWEGYAMRKWIADEAPKTKGLRGLFSMSNEIMKKGFRRVGTPVIFGCVCAGTKVWDKYGNLVNIEDLKQEDGILGYSGQGVSIENIPWMQPPAEKDCVKITTNTGRILECSTDHPILWSRRHFNESIELPKENGKRVTHRLKKTKFKEAGELLIGDQIAVIESVPIFGNLSMWEPRLIGWLIGDGTYGFDSTPMLSNCEDEINNYVYDKFNTRKAVEYITKSTSQVYRETAIKGICPKLREIGIYGQTKLKKTLPVNIHSYRKEDICELLGGFYDTDGYVCDRGANRNINLASASFDLLMEVKLLLQKLGIHGGIYYIKPGKKPNIKGNNGHYRLTISDRNSVIAFRDQIKLFVKRKQEALESITNVLETKGRKFGKDTSNINGLRFEKVKSIEYIGIKPIYNLEAGGSHTYIANGIVTHNTSGDVGKESKDFKEMWYNADIHKLNKFFLGGWMAIDGLVDEYGNDEKEEAIRCIVYERKRREGLSTKEYNDFLQQYPLTVQEAFTSNETSGLGNQIKLNQQINSLIENPPVTKKGYFVPKLSGNQIVDVEFKPDNRGQCIIFEDRKAAMKNLYIAGVDPTDHDTSDITGLSELSMFIMKKQDGLEPPKIVFEYTYRPNVPRDYYDQAMLALIYYNNAKVLIERNKAGMITYFDERGYKYLLQTTPQGLSRLIPGNTYNIGVYLTKGVKQYSEELIAEYIQDYCELIPSRALLEECQQYGAKNTDRVSAFAMCMIFLREDKTVAKSHNDALKRVPSWSYVVENGRMVRTDKYQKPKNNYKF